MKNLPVSLLLAFAVINWLSAPTALSQGEYKCEETSTPLISFIEFQSLDLEKSPPEALTIKAKLSLPPGEAKMQGKAKGRTSRGDENCFNSKKPVPAVVILHGSAGVDFRGDFYARALNAEGIATLEIDMWEARGVATAADRPPLPIFTYPDAFAALRYLTSRSEIDPEKVGVLGFSWGGVITMAAAEELYAGQFGGGLTFAAHAAHYPVCYGYNNPFIPPLNPPSERGTQWLNLTGVPVLIQIGTEDDYDNGAENCISLKDDLLDPEDAQQVEVVAYEGAYHAWDRLLVPITVQDPFADEGSIFMTGMFPEVEIIPDVEQAYESRDKVVEFFREAL